ncbi:glucan biosynthesis protein [Sphingobium sp. HWE2-09]|uniref:glucan biosynthesis protein n=1 Tax=Sphingobium sp. HWE2-09 TaxID=3108390 RepID=UPI002DC2EF54|nr:glucan biosynthesis protein [Sphingobium sp. HWE2-09]
MTKIDRRAMIAASGAALLLPQALRAQSRAEPFSWERLVALAQKQARAPFTETPLHPGAAKVDYDALHAARFRDDRTLWGDLPGDTGIRFFPLSVNAAQPVTIAIVDKGQATPLRYDPGMFDAPAGNAVAALGPDAGFAGFRIMNAARDGDWLSFLGASYFRAPSPQKQFGLSARAIAINTSLQGKEEFPRFTHFWLERTGTSSVTIYALLDGASISGAFRFLSSLGADGVKQDVTAALFPRRAIAELGLMPMTSMFWYDQANRIQGTDWRPEIHDSDLLSIASADGTAHARPIVNPSAPHFSAFKEASPKGFGLLQRDRDFDHYQDDGVFYDRRPSLWATPTRPLGAGQVCLYAFPTDSEYTDNVAVYWTPQAAPRAGARIDLAYRLDWSAARSPASSGMAIVENLWRGRGDGPDAERLVIDFAGVTQAKPDIWVDVAGGTLIKQAGYPVLGKNGLFRTVLDIRRAQGKSADIRLQLRDGGRGLSEYVHYPLGA